MNEMVERVAQVLFQGSVSPIHERPWVKLNERERSPWIKLARAAIEAMREPTQNMVKAAWAPAGNSAGEAIERERQDDAPRN